jgi:hypothetical protein
MTGTWQVEPSGPLRGDIRVRGSKNAVSKHMVAAMPVGRLSWLALAARTIVDGAAACRTPRCDGVAEPDHDHLQPVPPRRGQDGCCVSPAQARRLA